MKSNFFLHFITGCLLLMAAHGAQAEGLTRDEALSFAEVKGKELLTTFQEPDLNLRYQKLDKLFLVHVDADYIGKFVAGRYWRSMTEPQKERYLALFKRYGLAFYKTLPLEYAKNVEYKIKSAEFDGDFVNVAANIKVGKQKDAQEITVVFRLHKVGGVIKAVDVKIAESSLLLSYRGKFGEMIAQNDGEIEWFLEDFEDLVRSLEYNLEHP